ncbi:lipopolysaccharide biosynthesis protein [Methyloceanibacter sp.]|uniref:lipopolysaccharide biosynthesis protein n=1 Tax=Methyloceanibacter sp. TaxID=1965321 RepID=UPI002CD7E06C|nr:lipopolysaccharide biosynthesis protein [Methyloceanibacter sp.]HML92440.1 lipopolysaccharide biosynthesis protein [Methyloceanibacter sp.]
MGKTGRAAGPGFKAALPRASATFITGARLAGAGAGFLAQLLLARMLGAGQLGLFYAVTSLAAVAGIVVAQGYPAVTIRFAARYRAAPATFLAFLHSATRRSAIAVAVVCLAMAAAAVFYPFESVAARWALVLAAVLIPFIVFVDIAAAIASAARRFDIAYIPEVCVRPILFLGVIVLVAAAGMQGSAIVFLAVFVAITAALALVQWRLTRPLIPEGKPAKVPARLSRRWRREAHMAIVVALFLTAFADVAIVMSSPLMNRDGIAVFGLCLKLSFLVGFIVQVAHHVASPDLAEARNARDARALQRTLRRAVVLPAAATLAITVLAVFFGSAVLSLFGPDFAHGGPVLAVLIGAQAVPALAGPSVTMMTLSGAQRDNAVLCGVALAALAIACFALIPDLGAFGAALAVLIAMIVWQLAVLVTLRRRGEPRTDCLALLQDRAVSRGGSDA